MNQETTAFHSPPSPSAWPSLPPRWVLSLQCQGSRNVLSALRKAVEVDFKDKDKQQSQGIYLFTGGIPDQDVVGSPRPGHPLSFATPHLLLGGCLATGFSSMIFQSGLYHAKESPGDVVQMQMLLDLVPKGPESLHL